MNPIRNPNRNQDQPENQKAKGEHELYPSLDTTDKIRLSNINTNNEGLLVLLAVILGLL